MTRKIDERAAYHALSARVKGVIAKVGVGTGKGQNLVELKADLRRLDGGMSPTDLLDLCVDGLDLSPNDRGAWREYVMTLSNWLVTSRIEVRYD